MKKQPIQLDTEMTQMLKLSDKDLKISIINMLSDLVERIGSVHEEMRNPLKR